MPPAAKRNCGAIIYDLNPSNKTDALLTFVRICTYKWLSDTKDTYRLILFNSKESRNAKGFQNIYDTNSTSSDPRLLLNHIKNAAPGRGNWLEAIVLAIHHLKEDFEKPGVITLQILFITDLSNCSPDLDSKTVKQIISGLKEYGIYLYIVGPVVKLPYTITSIDDIPECMKKIEISEEIPSLSVAKKIVTNTDYSIMCDCKVGIHLFFSFKNGHGSQPWKVPISFGTRLEIPVCTVKTYKKDEPFKLSKGAVNYSHVLLEDETVKVDRDVLVAGVTRHGKFVKLDEKEMFKVEGPRNFSIMGFTDAQKVPEYCMRGDGTFLVLPDADKTEDCCQALYNLVDVLAEEKKYAIARRVYNANNKPKFFVLVPQPDMEPKCFVMSELPYADDVKQNPTFEEPKASGTADENETDDEFEQFFNSIDVWHSDCKIQVPLSPKLMLDPYTCKLADETAKKYLNEDFDFDSIDINDFKDSESNDCLDALKALWPENGRENDDDV